MQYVNKEYIELMELKYPSILTNSSHRRFLTHLQFGPKDLNSNFIITNSKTLAIIELGWKEGIKQWKNRNYSGTEFLNSLLQYKLPEFIIIEANYIKHQARCIAPIFDKEDLDIIDQQNNLLASPDYNKKNLYNPRTGNKYQPKDMAKEITELELEVNKFNEKLATSQQKVILDYLHSVNIKHFTKLASSKNAYDAFKLAAQIKDIESRMHQVNLLHKICTNPKPLYQPSENGNTERIFPYNESILSLKKDIRKEFCKNSWVEFDLASSQLAIISKLWNVPFITDYLINNNSIWKDLLNHMQLDFTEANKRIIKIALYGICFGMSKKNVLLHIEEYFDIECRKLFFIHPIIQSIFKARSNRIKAILLQGHLTTVYGKQVFVSGNTIREKLSKVRSMLAEEAQAFEAKLLEDIVVLAKTTKDFIITLWQSDGFSVRFTDRTKQAKWTKRIQQVVLDKANYYNIPTHLEVEIL